MEKEEEVSEYCAVLAQVESVKGKMRKWTSVPEVLLLFITRGRLVRVKDGKDDWGWGAVIDYKVRF